MIKNGLIICTNQLFKYFTILRWFLGSTNTFYMLSYLFSFVFDTEFGAQNRPFFTTSPCYSCGNFFFKILFRPLRTPPVLDQVPEKRIAKTYRKRLKNHIRAGLGEKRVDKTYSIGF